MDLAKIRKKSLQEQTEKQLPQNVLKQQSLSKSILPVTQKHANILSPPDDELFQTTTPVLVSECGELNVSSIDNKLERISVPIDPIEVILAGRHAAGCNEDIALADEDYSVEVSVADLEFLCFRVSDELYGINIMDIKEIIKPREVTEVPRAPLFVTGVLSLRGTIIPILDMRVRLGLLRENVTGKERIIVIKNNDSFSGLLVDEVIQVVRISKEAVEPAPAILEGINRDFVLGIGRSERRLLIILNLESIADIHLC
ncbi:MAG: chemotaxis protein CheW [Geobacter sp.]|nr:chemotaxis protein CheW [Geobacter sp.]